jgi:hypothetical protein
MVVGPLGTLYVTDNNEEGMGRTLDSDEEIKGDVDWENASNLKTPDIGYNNLENLHMTQVDDTNRLWGYTRDTSPDTVWFFDDTLAEMITGVVIVSQRENKASFSWDKMSDAEKYKVYLNTTKDFKGVSYTCNEDGDNEVDANHCSFSGLTSGTEHWFRVKVAAGEYLESYYNEEQYNGRVSFTTAMGPSEWSPFETPSGDIGGYAPLCGTTGVKLTPVFNWNASYGATGYEFVLSANPDYSSPIVSKTLTQTTFGLTEELDYNTQYYWKVRAVKDGVYSQWGEAVFQTMHEPEEPPPPVEIVQQAPPPTPAPVVPTTPAYIWVIIIIGAILVILVLILIMRTRRP